MKAYAFAYLFSLVNCSLRRLLSNKISVCTGMNQRSSITNQMKTLKLIFDEINIVNCEVEALSMMKETGSFNSKYFDSFFMRLRSGQFLQIVFSDMLSFHESQWQSHETMIAAKHLSHAKYSRTRFILAPSVYRHGQ